MKMKRPMKMLHLLGIILAVLLGLVGVLFIVAKILDYANR
jgi:uncharacterized protein YneF (UPF0154 family)